MNRNLIIVLLCSHVLIGAAGFGLGIYLLPIIIAPESPSMMEVNERSMKAIYSARFKRDLKDSDAFHWGDGQVFIGNESITFMGNLAPGPDYRLYLSPEFLETEERFAELKSSMVQVGPINTFENFIVHVPKGIDPSKYNTVIVWCETFGEFITAAKYR